MALAGVRGWRRTRSSRLHGRRWGSCRGSQSTSHPITIALRTKRPRSMWTSLPRHTTSTAMLRPFRGAPPTRRIMIVSNARCSSTCRDASFPRSIRRQSHCRRVVRFSPVSMQRRNTRAALRFSLPFAAHPSKSPEAVPVGGLTLNVVAVGTRV